MVIYQDEDEQLWKKEYHAEHQVAMVIQLLHHQLVKWLIEMAQIEVDQ